MNFSALRLFLLVVYFLFIGWQNPAYSASSASCAAGVRQLSQIDSLSLEEIIALNREILSESGSDVVGIRDPGAVESAAALPRASMFGQDLYPDVFSKATVLAFSIAESQAFFQGNKRTAATAALVLLRKNGYEVPLRDDPLFSLLAALGKKEMSKEEFEELFARRLRELTQLRDAA